MPSLTIHALIIVCRSHPRTAQSSQRADHENHHSGRRIEVHPAQSKASPLFAQLIGGARTGRRSAGDVAAAAGSLRFIQRDYRKGLKLNESPRASGTPKKQIPESNTK